MRVVHVINSLTGGGAENLVASLSIALNDIGVFIHIVTLYDYKDHSLTARLVAKNITVTDLGFKFRYDPRIPILLRRILKNGRYDIIHAHIFPSLYWTALVCPRNVITAVTEHSPTHHRRKWFLRPIEWFIYSRYHSIICISNIVRENFCAWLPALKRRTVIIFNGIDLERFQKAIPFDRSIFGVPQSTPLAIMVSRMDPPEKDWDTLFHSLTLIDNIHLLAVGTGSAESHLKNLAVRLGLQTRIHFLGYRTDIPRLLKTSDIFVLSSNFEGFGLVIVEAMACGIPVIVSSFQGYKDVIIENQTGFVFPIGNSTKLAELLTRVAGDPELRKSVGAAGIRHSQNFSIEHMAQETISLYHSLSE